MRFLFFFIITIAVVAFFTLTGASSATALSYILGDTDDVQLRISNDIETTSGETVTIPISFTPGAAAVTGLAFSIDFDEHCLAFDPQDLDSNGFPDAIEFFTPAAFHKIFFLDLTDSTGELDIILIDFIPPYTTLPALETFMTITLTATCDVPAGETKMATVAFAEIPAPTYTTTSQSLPLIGTNGSILIQSAHSLPITITPTPTFVPTAPPTTPTATPTLVPTAVPATMVEWFMAEVQETGILLRWQTSREVNTQSFAIHRLPLGQANSFIPVSSAVAGQSSAGGTYTFLDDQIDANSQYGYLLVEEKRNGRLIRYYDRLLLAGPLAQSSHQLLLPLIRR